MLPIKIWYPDKIFFFEIPDLESRFANYCVAIYPFSMCQLSDIYCICVLSRIYHKKAPSCFRHTWEHWEDLITRKKPVKIYICINELYLKKTSKKITDEHQFSNVNSNANAGISCSIHSYSNTTPDFWYVRVPSVYMLPVCLPARPLAYLADSSSPGPRRYYRNAIATEFATNLN